MAEARRGPPGATAGPSCRRTSRAVRRRRLPQGLRLAPPLRAYSAAAVPARAASTKALNLGRPGAEAPRLLPSLSRPPAVYPRLWPGAPRTTPLAPA